MGIEQKNTFKRFTTTNLITSSILLLLYALWIGLVLGYRQEHATMALLIIVLFYINDTTRKMLYAFGLFILYALIYDSMRVFPNYMFNEVHIIEPYNIEKSLFGIAHEGSIITPNEYFSIHHWAWLDILSGLFYLSWVPVPLLFTGVLYFMDKKSLVYFASTFFLCNLIGFTIYYLYPAAPPWYIEQYGLQENFTILGNHAGFVNFDAIFNTDLFEKMYVKGSNVFAAIPSLHSAYPVVLVYFAWRMRWNAALFLFLIQTLGIWFSAVYSRHHYIIDVFLGALCAITAILLFEKLLKTKRFSELFDRYLKMI